MEPEIDTLVEIWKEWSNRAGLQDAHVATDKVARTVGFDSADGRFVVRQEEQWWIIDEVDDRGRLYSSTAQFTDLDLVLKYLEWTWASTARTMMRLPQLGARFQKLGPNPAVPAAPANRPYFVEMRFESAIAVIPASKSIVLSHVLDMTQPELNRLVRQDLS